MGVKEIREVTTTYVCDFCKHNEVVVAETSHNGLPKGWSMLAIVSWDQNPRVEQMSAPDYYARDGNKRSCLSSDREIKVAEACPACSVYGLQVIKNAKPEPVPPPSIRYAFKMTASGFYALVGFSIALGAILGMMLNYFLHR